MIAVRIIADTKYGSPPSRGRRFACCKSVSDSSFTGTEGLRSPTPFVLVWNSPLLPPPEFRRL